MNLPVPLTWQTLSEVLDAGGLMFFALTPDGRISKANEQASSRLGHEPGVLTRVRLDDVLAEVPDLAQLNPDAPICYETELTAADGAELPVEVTLARLRDADPQSGVNTVAILRDISERRALAQRQAEEMMRDALTGLRNRNGLLSTLAAWGRDKSGDNHYGLIYLDIDEFAAVNESFGHHIGDDFLRMLIDRLRGIAGDEVVMARIGADDLVLAKRSGDVAAMEELAARILDSLENPLTDREISLRLTACMGIAVAPEHGNNPDEVLRAADAALGEAKRAGAGQVKSYSPKLLSKAKLQVSLQARLSAALRNNEFMLHYQPYFKVATGQLTGCEALIRWHDGNKPISPADFIPVAERSGIIVEIGEWVIHTVCQQLANWASFGFICPKVSLNVSAVQIKRASVENQLTEAMRTYAIEPDFLVVELTESSIMEKFAGELEKLNRIREAGVQLAIDDFGTGFSSLSYLTKMPLSTLKIDRSFIDPLMHDGGASALVTNAIVRLAQSLDLQVIAEGVEKQEQLDYLHEIGCDVMQGYLRSKPLPAEELAMKFLSGFPG